MDRSKNVIVWVAGFAGIVLLYAAYKGKSPLTVVATAASSTPTTPNTPQIGAGSANAAEHDAAALGSVSDGYVYDANGVQVGTVPDAYAKSQATFIPGS